MVAFGGFLALLGRVRRERRAGRRQDEEPSREAARSLWVPLAAVRRSSSRWSSIGPAPAGDDTTIRSQMIGKPMPDFALQPGVPEPSGPRRAPTSATGRPQLVNIFASWCMPCTAEAPQLEALKRRGVPIDGIAIRDRSEDVAGFLADMAIRSSGSAPTRRASVQFALGSSGVPETFVVDGKGVIRLQHIGDIRPEDVDGIFAAWEEAK